MTMLDYWLYVSTSTLSRDDCEVQVQHIVNVSKRRNAQCGVTGALLFSGQHFVQLIEGPQDAVAQIRASILQDIRHSEIMTIAEGEQAARSFEGWALAYSGRSQFIETTVARNLASFEKSPEGSRDELLRLLRGFV